MISGQRIVALLLSGGGGTRLWPASTETHPKQFLKLLGDRSLYQQTLARLSKGGVDRIAVVANAAHLDLVQQQAEEISTTIDTLMLEPMKRDSGPAIAAGVAAIRLAEPATAIVVALPCDHLIDDEGAFHQSLRRAVAVAELGFLVTFGISITEPSTEYGYIERGTAIANESQAYRVKTFHEKPAQQTARDYAQSGRFYWNSGIFAFRGDVFAEDAARHMPEIWDACCKSIGIGVRQTPTILRLDADAFALAPKVSIDHALFEKSDRVAVVPADFRWSDVGTWIAVHAASRADAGGNVAYGDVTSKDVTGSLLVGHGVRVVAIGIQDLVVVASPAGALVAPLHRAAELKQMLEQLTLSDKETNSRP